MKNHLLVSEDQMVPKLFIVKSGEVQLLKKITIRDLHDNPIQKQVCLVSATEGEVIGEDAYRFMKWDFVEQKYFGAQPSFYTAKAVGREGCVVFEAKVEHFLKEIPGIVGEFKRKAEQRRQFLNHIINKQVAHYQRVLRKEQVKDLEAVREAESI